MRPDRLSAMPEKSPGMSIKKQNHQGKRTITPEQFSPRAEICIDLYIEFVSFCLNLKRSSNAVLLCCKLYLLRFTEGLTRPANAARSHCFSFSVLSRWVVGSFTSSVGDFPSRVGVSTLLCKIHQFPDTCLFTLPVPQWLFATPWIIPPGPF